MPSGQPGSFVSIPPTPRRGSQITAIPPTPRRGSQITAVPPTPRRGSQLGVSIPSRRSSVVETEPTPRSRFNLDREVSRRAKFQVHLPIDGEEEAEPALHHRILNLLNGGPDSSADGWYSSMHMHDNGTAVFGKGGDPGLRFAIESLFTTARADFQVVAEVAIFFTTYEAKSGKGTTVEMGWLEAVQSLPATLPTLEVRAARSLASAQVRHSQLPRLCSG
jgi:hypothetical protein